MLTDRLHAPRMIIGMISILLLALTTAVAASPASAELCEYDQGGDKGIVWVDCDAILGHVGEEGGTESGGPSCEIEAGDNACYNGESCLINDPSTISEESVPEGALPPKPGDEYHHAFRLCNSGYVWYWTKEGEASVEELALRAYGELKSPPFNPTFNPPTRTLVNLDTWWWADGAPARALSETAGSVTVEARPSHMEVDPGDGSGAFQCEFVTSKADTCTHTYRRASRDIGYQGRMRLVWNLTITDSDAPIDLAGLPTSFSSPWESVTVPVREVQSLVTDVG